MLTFDSVDPVNGIETLELGATYANHGALPPSDDPSIWQSRI